MINSNLSKCRDDNNGNIPASHKYLNISLAILKAIHSNIRIIWLCLIDDIFFFLQQASKKKKKINKLRKKAFTLSHFKNKPGFFFLVYT